MFMAMKKFLGEALLTLMICAAIAAGIAALWDWRFCKGLFWLVFSGVFLVLCALMRAGLTHGFWALWDILRCRAVSQDLQYLGSVERKLFLPGLLHLKKLTPGACYRILSFARDADAHPLRLFCTGDQVLRSGAEVGVTYGMSSRVVIHIRGSVGGENPVKYSRKKARACASVGGVHYRQLDKKQ